MAVSSRLALYGSETWTLRKLERKYLEGLRRTQKPKFTEKVSNEVLERIGEKRTLLSNEVLERIGEKRTLLSNEVLERI